MDDDDGAGDGGPLQVLPTVNTSLAIADLPLLVLNVAEKKIAAMNMINWRQTVTPEMVANAAVSKQ